MLENGLETCTCKRKCERHGKCSECIAYHKTNRRYTVPYCKRKSDKNICKKGSS